MRSGLRDRKNSAEVCHQPKCHNVSMKSGVRDRNNGRIADVCYGDADVSMESGLSDRNNLLELLPEVSNLLGLNGVRS